VIDAHTHAFPPQIVYERDGYLGRDLWFEQLYRNPRVLLTEAKDILTSMDRAGIAQSVVCGFPWRDPGLCQEQNSYLAEACAGSHGRLVWLGIVSPAADPRAAQEAERCLALGAVGFGEFNADAQGFDLTKSRPLGEVAAVCLAHDCPILLHASEPMGHLYPGKGTATPDRLVHFLSTYPELRVALAHWGGGLPFYELMPEVTAAAIRVAYDSAATTYLYLPRVFRTVIDLVGAERVMFASDFPVLRQDGLLRRVQAMQDLNFHERRAILEETARDFYRIPAPHETLP
jgi:predicted TIM-barrel fold metal-dependent hydrolase